ncbi:TPA: exonuclease [Escherichia coli]|nr:exonuclease [Escherichia coli]
MNAYYIQDRLEAQSWARHYQQIAREEKEAELADDMEKGLPQHLFESLCIDHLQRHGASKKAITGIDVRAVEQGDDAWHKLRLGVITASEVHNVIAKPRSGKKWPDMKMSYFHTLLAEVCTGVAPEVNAKALAWGKQYENDARALFEFTSGVNVTESPIIYRDESMRTACSPDGLCSDGNGLELKCPFTSRDFMKFRLGGFEAIKSAYMAQVQYSMWVTRKDAWYFANYDPRMKREGLHYVVIEQDEKYMASFDEMVPEFIEKMDEALAEIGFVFGEQWR